MYLPAVYKLLASWQPYCRVILAWDTQLSGILCRRGQVQFDLTGLFVFLSRGSACQVCCILAQG